MKPKLSALLVLFFCCHFAGISFAAAEALQADAETTTHGDEAAFVQVIEDVNLPDFVFRQYSLGVLSHYSYLLGSGGEAMIIDPVRDIDSYLKDANALGLEISRVYLTHSHADFVAGHMALKNATGAEIIVNEKTGAEFRHTPVVDGSQMLFGNVRTVVKATPGHTPDGTCLYVYYPAASPQPRMVLTGDTLFIGGVGRPDLLEGAYSSAQLARMLFHTWKETLSKVPDETKIYPAHGAGSLCGAHLSDEPSSTFGAQKRSNPYLRHRDLSTFVMAVIDGLGAPPQYFAHNASLNRSGPALANRAEELPPALTPIRLREEHEKGAWVIDVRDSRTFAAGHLPGAINIGVRGRLETWVGTMAPWGTPLVLLGSDAEVKEAALRLLRIGYDRPLGYLKGGMAAWEKSGQPNKTIALVSPLDLYKQMQDGSAPVTVDVRLPAEWMSLRIGNVLNIPLNKLFEEAARLEPSMPVLMVCNSAYRSSMAGSIMQRLGFEDVRNLDGGSQAWIDAGLPTYGSESGQKVVTAGEHINLPERVSPEDLAQKLMDLPGSVEVVDIRPVWQYSEYHLPGSKNVPVQELMSNPAYLVGKRPLVIVCRDGFIAAAVGGALVQKSPRSVRFLSGGVRRYYDEIVRPAGILSDRTPAGIPTEMPELKSGTPGNTPSTEPATKPVRKKKPSAGC